VDRHYTIWVLPSPGKDHSWELGAAQKPPRSSDASAPPVLESILRKPASHHGAVRRRFAPTTPHWPKTETWDSA